MSKVFLWIMVYTAIGIALVEGLYLTNAFRRINELEKRIEKLENAGKSAEEL